MWVLPYGIIKLLCRDSVEHNAARRSFSFVLKQKDFNNADSAAGPDDGPLLSSTSLASSIEN
jgi:hypothetical protein